jgi:uncharacterized ion transporter superfamily protein YfcC
VIAIVLFGVWLLTFVVPAGKYDLTAEGASIPGSYKEIPARLIVAIMAVFSLLGTVEGMAEETLERDPA